IYGELRELTQGAEYESQRRFARRCNFNRQALARHIKRKELATYGPRRLIKIAEGLASIERLRENKAKYEKQVEFGKRIGVGQRTITDLIRRGLPKAANAEICIDDALAWLKREGLLSEDGKYINPHPQSTPGF